MANLKLGKDSPDPGEHRRYPESMSEVPRKDFLTNFQKSYFFQKAFFSAQTRVKKKLFGKNMIFENSSENLF